MWKLSTKDHKATAFGGGGDDDEAREVWVTSVSLRFGPFAIKLVYDTPRVQRPLVASRDKSEDIYDLSWSSDSLQLAAGSIDNAVRVWDVQKGWCHSESSSLNPPLKVLFVRLRYLPEEDYRSHSLRARGCVGPSGKVSGLTEQRQVPPLLLFIFHLHYLYMMIVVTGPAVCTREIRRLS